MRVVIQRVKNASVSVSKELISSIGVGLLILAGWEEADNQEDLEWMAAKIIKLRIFEDEEGVMNKSVQEVEGEILLVSQFTLHALTKKGNRPSYIKAARPERAIPFYEDFISLLEKELGRKIQTGKFGADMDIMLTNVGPVTIMIDSKNKE